MFKKIKNNILIFIGFAAIIYLGFIIYADFDSVVYTVQNISSKHLFIAFILILVSLFFKFIRWQYYLNFSGFNIKIIDSILIFTSGLVMSLSPGKIGELLKSYLIKERFGIPISKTSHIVLAERIIEFTALLLISMIGALFYNYGAEFLFLPILLTIIFLTLIRNDKIISTLLNFVIKLSPFKKSVPDIENFNRSLKRIFAPLVFAKSLFISALAWITECLAYIVILENFGYSGSYLSTTFFYCIAMIIGAVSMMPGGLAATEGTLSFLLVENGLSEQSAVVSTLLIRILTLWFSVFVGFISLLIYLGKRNLSLDEINKE